MTDDMMGEWVAGLVKAFYIAEKDAKVYYFKAPNFTYGLLIPVSLYLAFGMAGEIGSKLIVAGLTSLVARARALLLSLQ